MLFIFQFFIRYTDRSRLFINLMLSRCGLDVCGSRIETGLVVVLQYIICGELKMGFKDKVSRRIAPFSPLGLEIYAPHMSGRTSQYLNVRLHNLFIYCSILQTSPCPTS
jgi:hypothetical protein